MKKIEIPPWLKGWNKQLDAEYAMRYKVLYSLMHGLPVSANTNWDVYCRRLKLVDQQPDGSYKVSENGYSLYFTPDHDVRGKQCD